MTRYLRFPAYTLAGLLAVGMAGSGCKDMMGHKDEAMDMSKPLYERLGGEPAVKAVVHDFVGIAATDPAVNFDRKNPTQPKTWDATPEHVAKLEKHLVQFIAANTGGPKMYEGKDMTAVHTGMKITDAEFGAIAGDLKKALEKNHVPAALQDELIAVVASTKPTVVIP